MIRRLIPLVVGTLDININIFDPLAPVQKAIEAPMIMWIVETDRRVLIFDTGGTSVQSAHQMGHLHYRRPKDQEPCRQLAAVGISESEVDAVLVSHLHWDHAANWAMFAAATVFVGKDEVAYAMNPDAEHRKYYDYVDGPADFINPNRFTLVKERTRVWQDEPDLEFIPLPGHTPGSIGLLAYTKWAVILLPGDAVPLRINLTHDPPSCNGIAVDTNAFFTTLQQLEKNWTVFPSHDPEVRKFDKQNVLEEHYWKGGEFTWK